VIPRSSTALLNAQRVHNPEKLSRLAPDAAHLPLVLFFADCPSLNLTHFRETRCTRGRPQAAR